MNDALPGTPTTPIPLAGTARIEMRGEDVRYFARNPRGAYQMITRAEGVYLYTETGRPILDGASGAAVVCLGHRNRRVLARMQQQADRVAFAHTSTFVTEPVLELARRLARYSNDPAARVYFVSGGSEATETALKIARTYQLAMGRGERHAVISRSTSYHGATLGALAMTGVLQRRKPYEPLLTSFPKVDTCYCYRCPVGLDPRSCHIECADSVEEAMMAEDPTTVAGLILEPIIGSSAPGVAPHGDYLQRVAAACRRHDVLLIADEVMSGVGRTGRFFGVDHYGVTPDIITLSKGISSGYYPLAAVIVTGRVFDVISQSGAGEFIHGFTYAGSPLGAAVGLEVLDILEEEHLVERAAGMGALLLERLEVLRQFPMVGDVRGKGLLLGIELVADKETKAPFPVAGRVGASILAACLEEGLAVYPSSGSVGGLAGDNILIAPPYIITEAQIGELVEKLTRGIGRVQQALADAGALAGSTALVVGHE